MADLFQPRWLGKFELLRPLGSGGMAEVFLARATGPAGFEKVVVVKKLLEQTARHQRFVDLFINEAKVVVLLHHPNIVQVYSLEFDDGLPFIVMEHVHGKDLSRVLRDARRDRTPIPVDFGIHCIAEMLKGLGYAHTAQDLSGAPLCLVHHDVTPSNVFVSYDGEVKLGDFGVATIGHFSNEQIVRGKVGYFAPEVLQRGDVDARSDLFSAGVILWEVLAQARLFTGRSNAEIMEQIAERVPEPPSVRNPRVSPDLDRIVARALEKDPDRRFQSAQEFEQALADYLYARGLRWTQRRISDVMKARYVVESLPLELPRPSAKPGWPGAAGLLTHARPLDDVAVDDGATRLLDGLFGQRALPVDDGPSWPTRSGHFDLDSMPSISIEVDLSDLVAVSSGEVAV